MPNAFDVRARSPRRAAGLLLAAVLVGPACGGGRGEPPAGTSIVFKQSFSANLNRNLDLLFVIDDSSSSRLAQDNLIRNFPTFVTALQGPTGEMPGIHLGVVSSDMGGGDGSIAGCDATGGKNGILQYTPRGTCTSSGLQAGATFISDVGGVRNYTGALADV